MADINVERREAAPWWLWALGLIIVGLLAFWLATMFGGDEEVALQEPAAYPVEPAPDIPAEPAPLAIAPPVQEYIDTCGADPSQPMGLDHTYTSNCVQSLVSALDAITRDQVTGDPAIQQQITDAREAADLLVQSPDDADRHAEMTRNAFTSVVAVLDRLQSGQFPGLNEHVGELTSIAESIQPDRPLLGQEQAVQSFFSRAGDALRSVGQTGTTIGV